MITVSTLTSLALVAGGLLASPTSASPSPTSYYPGVVVTKRDGDVSRALPDSPSGGYAPKAVDCPADRPVLRDASSLSPGEAAWLAKRRNATVQPLIDFLQRAAIPNFDAASYINSAAAGNGSTSGGRSAQPTVALAVSGGGYRALMNGAGFLAAADSRTPHATGSGGIGGLLQASTYLAGLSGGGWLVGSLYANNFTSVVQLRDGSPGSSAWEFNSSIFSGPAEGSGFHVVDTARYWADVADQVSAKADAGFDTSITDYWGRALSYQLVNATDGGPAYTFSSIADTDGFAQAQMPFPVLVSDGRAPGTKIVSLNSTVFEFNAFEMGSWDPTTFGFAPTRYLASNFSNGSVPAGGNCVEGFDQIGYVMGTSSTLFNAFLLQNITSLGSVPTIIVTAIEDILQKLGDSNNDIAQYAPNPFYGYHPDTAGALAQSAELDLVDGGEDLQNIPLQPLIQPARGVDVVFAVDSSADTDSHWPNGTSLRATWDRSGGAIANGTLFPPVPDENTFINLGLNARPSFFGCNASNFTLSAGQVVPPLIVYLPNAPYTAMSNISTFTATIPTAQRDDIIRNGFDGATMGNGTLDVNWPVCVACAVLSRSFARTNTTVPTACNDCFSRYCWNGTLAQSAPAPYNPEFIIGNQTTSEMAGSAGRRVPERAWLGLVVGLSALLIL